MAKTNVHLRETAKRAASVLHQRTGFRVDPHTLALMRQDMRDAVQSVVQRDHNAEILQADKAHTREDWFEFSRGYFGVGPVQYQEEIFGLFDMAADNGTRAACEIGAQDAGTSVLFTRCLPDLRVFVVMDLFVKNRWRLRRTAPAALKVHAIDGDSAHPNTVARLRRRLGDAQLDLLLIDGDHRYQGVRADFLAYRHLVRPGGIIAFHDIQGGHTPGFDRFVGGVPAFWTKLRELFDTREFVKDRGQQEGLGIGALRYDPTVSVSDLV